MSDTQDEASIEFLISVEGLVTFTKQQTFTKAIRGKRGAGRWNVPVSTLPSTSSLAEAAWQAWANSPGAAVYKDQAWFFSRYRSFSYSTSSMGLCRLWNLDPAK